jgi:hypothetical protein
MVDLWSYQQKEMPRPRISSPARTRRWRRKSACWPMPKSSMPRRWEPSSSFTRAALRPRLRPARRPAQRRGAGPLRRALHRGRAAAGIGPRHLGDLSASLRDYAEGIDASPERLAEIEDRLAADRPPQAQVRPDGRRGDRLWRGGGPQAGRGRGPRRNPQGARRLSTRPPRPIAPPPQLSAPSARPPPSSWPSWPRPRSTRWP